MKIDILEKYLKKLGVKSYVDLNQEEKDTYNQWQESLSGRKLTDEDVEHFFSVEFEDTINKLIKETTNSREDIFLKMKLDMLKKIRSFLDAPKMEKKILEQNLENML
jgi:hypothetical protein